MTGRGELAVLETSAQAGSGRLTGKTNVAWDYTSRVDGQIRFGQMAAFDEDGAAKILADATRHIPQILRFVDLTVGQHLGLRHVGRDEGGQG